MRHSTKPPTKAEAERIEAMMRLGCSACASIGIPHPAEECHHIVQGNVRMGHLYTIPFCRGHHRGVWSREQTQFMQKLYRVSLCDGRRAWTRIYPTERDLWITLQTRLHLPTDWPESKVLPRRIA